MPSPINTLNWVHTLDDGILSRPPILLIHGADDEVVPAGMSEMSAEALKREGFDVDAKICPDLAHSIDETGLQLGVGFLLRVFGDE